MAHDREQLREFARRYTAAWCSQDPARVADHYELDGSLTINGGTPSEGRAAITEAARSFMTAFPDMEVLMDDLVVRDEAVEYHWTLVGTNTGPGGTGNRVRISGFEEWTIGGEGLVVESQGHFDQAEYDSQLEHGVTDANGGLPMSVVSVVSARITPDRRDDVIRRYSEMVGQGLPPAIQRTLLLSGEDGTMAVTTVWKSRGDLDAMLASGEEPFARRLLREAGGEPEASFFDVVAEAHESH